MPKIPSEQTLVAPEPHAYNDIYEAPAAWRHLNHAALTVVQLNRITARAYELGQWITPAEGMAPFFSPNWGVSKREFRETHQVVSGQWSNEKGE